MLCRLENEILGNDKGMAALDETLQRSIEWLILRLIKVGARVSDHARKWHVHISTAFPLAAHYREVFDSG